MELIKEAKKIKSMAAAFIKTGKKQDVVLHLLACSTLEHIRVHGDTTVATGLINTLIAGMPRSSRVNALKAWYGRFGKLNYSEKTKEIRLSSKPGKVWDIEGAMATPFWNKPDTESPEWNESKVFNSAIGYLKSKIALVKKHDGDTVALEKALNALTA